MLQYVSLHRTIFFQALYQWYFVTPFHMLVADEYKREIYWQLAVG